jgi:hypothetical protein
MSCMLVTGAGPDGDSNGSGKTSFLGAVSLLLAEPQWCLSSDGRLTRALLFKPESAGLKLEQGYRAAEYGYIAGVFAASAEDPEADAVTVWVRIGASPPYAAHAGHPVCTPLTVIPIATVTSRLTSCGTVSARTRLVPGRWHQPCTGMRRGAWPTLTPPSGSRRLACCPSSLRS